MAKELVTDGLWAMIEPLLPEEPPKPNGGRPRTDDRAALTGIMFAVLITFTFGLVFSSVQANTIALAFEEALNSAK